ncbi:enoyl-CoA hydratase/isomerase family protein [Pseudonocardia pini]|uniref:enoyl-CoA hydratase/isomerase family protein n=1 Tax=Pseudonocardia pini TaxID=2758030 RepID=UPI0028AEC5BE|nr:enoyl-CoA hydratase/isomerase family protein [Pseudonocardia pini]
MPEQHSASSREALTVAVTDGVWEITLTRPELMNRFDDVLESELLGVLQDLANDRDARSAVLLSQGKVFSAGGDFDLILAANRDTTERLAAVERARSMLAALIALPQPLVVGVQGAAVGLGATIALAADAVVASRNARIADTHVGVGLAAGDGGALYWPQSAGMLRARRYLLTGDMIDAAKAYEFGLVTDLVDEPGEVADVARGIATRIAALPPLAVQGTKRALNQLTRQRLGEVGETALLQEALTLGSADLAEAVAAFKEKRAGKFVGE